MYKICFVFFFYCLTTIVECCVDQGNELFMIEAVKEGNIEILLWLLKHKANINVEGNSGRTPLMHAIIKGEDNDIIKLLINEKSDLNKTDADGKTALQIAAEFERLDALRILEENGAELNSKDLYGRTIAHSAASKGFISVIDELKKLSSFDDMINEKDGWGRSPSWYAALGGHEKFLNHLEDIGVKNESDLVIAGVYGGNLDIVKHLVDRGGNTSARNESGMSLLQIACDKGFVDIVTYLLDLGSDINIIDREERNLLHISSQTGKPDLIAILIKNGLSPKINDKDMYGNSPLHYGVLSGHTDAVSNLLTSGADYNVRNELNISPVDEATIRNDVEMLQIFFDKGYPVNQNDSNGKTILHKACENGAFKSVEFISNSGADLNAKDKIGNRPIHYALKDIQSLKILLNKSVEIDANGENNKTALQMAVDSINMFAVKCLLKNGAHSELVRVDSVDVQDPYFAYGFKPFPTKRDIRDLFWKIQLGYMKVSDLEC